MMVTHTRPSINPRITGVGMKAATQPMRSAPKSRKKAPIKIARVGSERIELRSSLYCDGAHGQRGDQAGRGVRTDDQQARCPEQRVGDQWWNDRVEPHDRRHPDNARIRHALRHHDCPDREAGQGNNQWRR
jgi:hypothetical protein